MCVGELTDVYSIPCLQVKVKEIWGASSWCTCGVWADRMKTEEAPGIGLDRFAWCTGQIDVHESLDRSISRGEMLTGWLWKGRRWGGRQGMVCGRHHHPLGDIILVLATPTPCLLFRKEVENGSSPRATAITWQSWKPLASHLRLVHVWPLGEEPTDSRTFFLPHPISAMPSLK